MQQPSPSSSFYLDPNPKPDSQPTPPPPFPPAFDIASLFPSPDEKTKGFPVRDTITQPYSQNSRLRLNPECRRRHRHHRLLPSYSLPRHHHHCRPSSGTDSFRPTCGERQDCQGRADSRFQGRVRWALCLHLCRRWRMCWTGRMRGLDFFSPAWVN